VFGAACHVHYWPGELILAGDWLPGSHGASVAQCVELRDRLRRSTPFSYSCPRGDLEAVVLFPAIEYESWKRTVAHHPSENPRPWNRSYAAPRGAVAVQSPGTVNSGRSDPAALHFAAKSGHASDQAR
jgi:hypothetical protein